MFLYTLRLPLVIDILKLPIFRKIGIHVLGKRRNKAEYNQAELTGRIDFKSGEGNIVRIGSGSKVPGKITIEGSGNLVEIGNDCVFRGDILVKGRNQKVIIGDNTTMVGVYILCQEGCDIIIGRHCMFSRNIEVRTTDAHSLIDRKTAKRINPAASVTIGDHVWIGVGSIINKGAVIPHDTVIGAMSFVNDVFDEESTVIAGVPANVVRRDVTWNRGRRQQYNLKRIDAWRE